MDYNSTTLLLSAMPIMRDNVIKFGRKGNGVLRKKSLINYTCSFHVCITPLTHKLMYAFRVVVHAHNCSRAATRSRPMYRRADSVTHTQLLSDDSDWRVGGFSILKSFCWKLHYVYKWAFTAGIVKEGRLFGCCKIVSAIYVRIWFKDIINV